MADPILGINAIIQFDTGDGFANYACAENFDLSFSLETKSVKTIGDGVWEKKRGQKKSYKISLTGVIKFDDGLFPHAFDLYDYFDQMTAIPFQIIYEEPETTLLKVVAGNALPTELNFGAPTEGFASGNITLEGYGAPTVADSTTTCDAVIGSASYAENPDGPDQILWSGVSGAARIEYTINGGGRLVLTFNPGTNGGAFIGDYPPGTEFILYPVCESGYDGTSYTINI